MTDIPADVLEKVSTYVLAYDEVPEGAGVEPSMEVSVETSLGLDQAIRGL